MRLGANIKILRSSRRANPILNKDGIGLSSFTGQLGEYNSSTPGCISPHRVGNG